jgi:glycosyltransferase involved in cell wall biosynthesis
VVANQPSAQHRFTVFTPTYNRAPTLARLYESLRRQTFRDFEWLIVDDGSEDETAATVEGWIAERELTIRYLRQHNQGKHVAFNRAVREARGELFWNVDSDDEALPQALERLDFHWWSIPDDQRPSFSAVTGLCVDQHGTLVGTPFPRDVTDSDPLELRYRFKVRGEKAGFQRTDVLRDHPFPEPPGERYVTESIVWDRIGRRYRTRFVNEPVRVYHLDHDASNLTTQVSDVRRLSAMFAMVERDRLNADLHWMRHAPWEFFVTAAQFTRHSLHRRVGFVRQARQLRWPARPLWLIASPLGMALWARDRLQRR